MTNLITAIVIIVHGWTGAYAPTNPIYIAAEQAYYTLQSDLTAAGYQAYLPILPGNDNYQNAAFLRDYINQVAPNGQHVQLIGHSMGGLSARWYVTWLGGASRVDRLVDLGVPNHGNWWMCLWPEADGGQMCPTNVFMTGLNLFGDTVPPASYFSFYGNTDVLSPPSTLAGACNYDFGAIPHDQEPSNPTVVALVENALHGICP